MRGAIVDMVALVKVDPFNSLFWAVQIGGCIEPIPYERVNDFILPTFPVRFLFHLPVDGYNAGVFFSCAISSNINSIIIKPPAVL